jgi:hypothetical protein
LGSLSAFFFAIALSLHILSPSFYGRAPALATQQHPPNSIHHATGANARQPDPQSGALTNCADLAIFAASGIIQELKRWV